MGIELANMTSRLDREDQKETCLIWYNTRAESHKEKSPPTTTNLASSDQQLEEKIPLTTDNNNDNSSLLNNDNTPDVDYNGSKVDLEPKEEVEEEIKFSPDYKEKEPIFWHVFEELPSDNNGLVDFDNLQQRLVSTGQFFVGEAVLMIEHMVKIGKIEQTGDYNIYRIKESASPNAEGGNKP
jgi:hypothetical protein